ncbi:MAG: hypothetical protein ABSC19_18030, partial [Syntrophorhabdales bacterium]
HFTLIRVLLLAGWIRVLSRSEFRGLRLNVIDRAFIVWVAVGAVMYVVRQGASSEAAVNRLGFVYNAVMAYFLFRALVRDMDDVIQAIRLMAIVMLPLAALICVERMTGRNIFAVFGGVPELTVVREGRLRCQGPFRHPILAGTYGATSIPLFIAVWAKGRASRGVIAAALTAAGAIVILSSSSGPVMALLGVVAGLIMWRFRENIRLAWWAALFAVVSLHLVMKAPVWALIGRASTVVGGTGWHRSELIDQAIKHAGEWWLWGTDYTAHWMSGTLPDQPNMIDITNQYIAEGVNGGLLTMLLFIGVIILCFRQLGRRLRVLYGENAKVDALATWFIGVAVFAHALSFLSVAYFDQLTVFWYFALGCISSISGYSERVIAGMEEAPEGGGVFAGF